MQYDSGEGLAEHDPEGRPCCRHGRNICRELSARQVFRDGAAHNQSPPLSLGNFVDAKSFEQDSCRSQQESGEKDFLKPPPIGDNNPDSLRGSVNPEADRDVDFGAVESKGRTRTRTRP